MFVLLQAASAKAILSWCTCIPGIPEHLFWNQTGYLFQYRYWLIEIQVESQVESYGLNQYYCIGDDSQ